MALLNQTVLLAAILLIAALSGIFSEKGGIVNIAIEGFMTIGALFFCVFSVVFQGNTQYWTFIFAVIASGLVVALFSAIHGFATIVLKVDHVVSGTAINLLAGGIGIFVSHIGWSKVSTGGSWGHLYSAQYLDPVGVFPTTTLVYFMFGFLIAITIWTYFKYTKSGIAHAAVGENPNAVDSAGLRVVRIKWKAVLISGFLSGIAGAMMMMKMNVFSGNVQGVGFLALAIMILGQWRPWIIFGGSIVFALLYALADNYVFSQIPKEIMRLIPFAASLVVLVILSRFQSAPKAAGLHFDKARR